MPATIADTIISTDDGEEFALIPDGRRRAGGYGRICRAAKVGGGRKSYAVKFMLARDAADIPHAQPDAAAASSMAVFENEVRNLEMMNRACDTAAEGRDCSVFPFPRFYGRGVKLRVPFYVMEWLEPLDLRGFVTDAERVDFARALCDAAAILHDNGLVHCDISPSNILCRPRGGKTVRREIVLADFGSSHMIEEALETGDAIAPDGGLNAMPNTPGYADPLETRHTVNCDIYAIGQVMRDMFGADVPPQWAKVILRCIDRDRAHRFHSAAELREALAELAR